MAKDKVVELVQGKPAKEDVKKSLCTVVIDTSYKEVLEVYEDVAGYQLLEGCLIILIHEGATHIIPMSSIIKVTIKANKE